MILFALLASVTTSAAAQTIRGIVLEDSTMSPVAGATIQLSTAKGRITAQVTSDNRGLFELKLSATAPVRLRVRRLGYEERYVQLADTAVDSVHSIEIVLRPVVATLTPAVIEASRRVFTLVKPSELGKRLITPERVGELLPRVRTVEDFVMLQSIPGVSIYDEPPNIRCARLNRSRSAQGRTALGEPTSSVPRMTHNLADLIGCMMMFVNNVRVQDLIDLDPNTVEMIVVLLPHEGRSALWDRRLTRRSPDLHERIASLGFCQHDR